MANFPTLRYMLKTVFSTEVGLSESAAIRIYLSAARDGNEVGLLKDELERSFVEPEVSWRELLLNDEYEVIDASSEEEARSFAKRVLWEPLFSAYP
jgi:hypothetical protein